jgi:diaminohydroxyphosphoribosylaminopyrimidine deaminase/5-amino-6-(5-phosphoribosylamino)uracil reductase
MARALAAARAGLGATYPNPCVGAAVAVAGRVVAVARSDRTGGPHAEVRALRKAGAAAKGCTLYVTLEPCDHHGRTPPCTAAIIDAKVRRVVVGVRDPAAHVAGRGVRRLRRAGIEVVEGVLADQCRSVHEHYLHHATTGLPFVTLKSAASLDGRIAVRTGDSRWITSEASRRIGHRLRAWHHAIAVGVDTVLADDPRLDVRLVQGVAPIPVVFDSRLRLHRARTPPRLVRAGTLVLHTARASAAARRALARTGVELVEVDAGADGRVDVGSALQALGDRPIRSLLVEGGGALLGAFVHATAWQSWQWFCAPRILGEGVPAVAGVGWDSVADAPRVRIESRRRVGDDLHLVLRPHTRRR